MRFIQPPSRKLLRLDSDQGKRQGEEEMMRQYSTRGELAKKSPLGKRRRWSTEFMILVFFSLAVTLSSNNLHLSMRMTTISTDKGPFPTRPKNRSNEIIIMHDITPKVPDSMFCAALWQKGLDGYLALAGKRPARGMTAYRLAANGSIQPSYNHRTIAAFQEWEDPRLLELSDGVVLAFMQTMGRPFGVARWFYGDETIGPISELRLQLDGGEIVKEATKNWSPFAHGGVLHFLISAIPTIVVRCQSKDDLNWDICVPQRGSADDGSQLPPRDQIQDWQTSMIYRGGSDFRPYPSPDSSIFVGFLHTRYQCENLSGLLHVPVMFVFVRVRDGMWRHVYISDVPSFKAGDEWPVSRDHQKLLGHHIQDPVSVAKIDASNGNVYVTLNLADEAGRCALGMYEALLPPTSTPESNNWIIQAARMHETYNITGGREESFASILHMCNKRYGPKR